MIQPAVAGQVVILYGTGLGAVDFDESLPVQVKDIGGTVALYVGAKAANVLYHGRSSCCAGLDQINFVVPAGVESCAAPVAIVVGGVTSNIATMSIAGVGATTCSDAIGFSTADLLAAQTRGKLTFGEIYFESAWLNKGNYGESGFGNFYEATFDQLLTLGTANWVGLPGACYSPLVAPRGLLKPIDAGPALTYTGITKSTKLNLSSTGLYGIWSASDAAPSVITEGIGTLDNGAGSSTVDGFKSNITIAKAPVWTNQDAATSIDRSKELTITWSGGDPNGTMIFLANTTGGTVDPDFAGGSTALSCYARTSVGQFTIPAWVISKLSPTTSGTFGTLRVGSVLLSPRFSTPGMDMGYFEMKRDSQVQPLTVR